MSIYRFDDVALDTASLRLTVRGEPRPLEPKSFRLLQFLIENRDRVVSKDEIFRVVWEEMAVTDNALTRAVAQIRKMLDDDPKQPRFIETAPTIGYRFIGELKPEESAVEAPSPTRRRLIFRAGAAALLAIVVGLTAWSRLRPAPPVPPVAPPVPLTSYPGSEAMPAFSPDGNQVAFQWDGEKQDNADIYVKVLGSESPLRLTSDPAQDAMPSWSPDGRMIAFIRETGPQRRHLILIPSLGGAERKLAEITPPEKSLPSGPAWSPDGKFVLVATQLSGREQFGLIRVSVETGEISQLTDPGGLFQDRYPSVSPDGKMILWVRATPYNPGDLYTAAIDAGATLKETPYRINTGGLRVMIGKWMVSGREILAVAPSAVYRLPATGTETPERIPWIPPAWLDLSSKGNRLVMTAGRGDVNIWHLDLNSEGLPVKNSSPARLLVSTFRDAFPQYSPDGNYLLFYSNRGGGATQTWIAKVADQQARQLTFTKPGLSGSATWSPDGKMLALDSNSSGAFQVFTMSPDGGKMTQMTQGPSSNFGATWSRDGRWLYFSSNRSGRNEVWKMPSRDGATVQVTKNGGARAIESLDGKTLYISKDTGTGSIWQMVPSGGEERQLATSLYRNNFAVTKLGVYYVTNTQLDGNAAINFYRFDSGNTVTILQIGRPEYGLDVSPDGRNLVYARVDNWASDLMLVENFR